MRAILTFWCQIKCIGELQKSRYIYITFSILRIMLLMHVCNILCIFVLIVIGEFIVCLLLQAAAVCVHVHACKARYFFIVVGYMVV